MVLSFSDFLNLQEENISVKAVAIKNVKYKVPKGYVLLNGFGLANSNGEIYVKNNGEPFVIKSKAGVEEVARSGLLPGAKFVKLSSFDGGEIGK